MGVTAPHLAGIGGGFVAIFYNETSKKVRTLESIGFAPSLTTEDTFASNLTLYKSGATAAIVPGAMAGYEVLHRELGMLEWHKLFDPAIRLATEGFVIGPHFARSLSRHRDRIEAHAELKSRFWNNSGNRLLQEGELLTQQPLADLLSDIAIHGGRFFYEGKVAADIADSVKKSGGLISEADLSDYKAEWKDPITVDLPYGLLFHSAASPGSGALLAAAVAQTAPNYALNLQHNPHADVALNGQELHRLVETLKFVYARRSELGDEQDAQNMEGGLVKEIVDKFNKTFNPNRALRSARDYGLKHPFAEDYGGAHLCVITPDGHALSITSSLNSEFGSLFTTARGILLNNYMDAFVKPFGTDASKKRANLPGPFKTPITSMAPVILTRDQSPSPLHALFGGSGGLAGLSAVAQLITCASEKLYRPCIEDEMRVHPQLESTNFRVNVAGKGNYIDAVQVLHKYGHQVSEKFIPSTAIGIMPTREGVLVAINDAEHADGGDVGGA
ncbi:glutathione hydrolase 1 proenzyme-like [Haemaphysalis longicornis]